MQSNIPKMLAQISSIWTLTMQKGIEIDPDID